MAEKEPRPVPAPGEGLRLRFTTIEPGRIFHRLHPGAYHATAFNGTPNGNARFSPIRNPAGEIIPTIYGAETLHCAAMETIFRDLAFLPAPRHIDMSRFDGHQHSQVKVEKPLKLVDLTSKSLTALGLMRRDLIDTDGSRYGYTQKWAEAIHARAPDAQGLVWVSRQDDTAQVIVLFGDRVEPNSLKLLGQSVALQEDSTWDSLLDLLEILDADASF
ncbi:RES family NAD+ phosphorylase [Pseudomonas putida]|uniref:RES family NAD+ phosphorylase n=1 Tax=Pseudomonas putida TaxID=303 RepID=UPI002B243D15|nr:RES family NAD+ phosphorylase [Pseudomonas putida]